MMAERFAELSPSEFFYRNKELAGYTNPSRSLYSSFRELLENSLDACELHRITPDIYVRLSLEERKSDTTGIYRLRVQDNGSGVPGKEVLKAFGRVFYSSKYVFRQSRGTFGLGGTMALLYGQITTNIPIRVVTSTGKERIFSYRFLIDVEKNIPHVVERHSHPNKNRWRGTIVEVALLGNYPRILHMMIAYLKQTAVAAPYAEFKFADPSGRLFFFRRTTREVPKPPRVGKPHPHGVDVEALKKLIRDADPGMTMLQFLCDRFHRVGVRTARKFLRFANIEFDTPVGELEMKQIMQLSERMQNFSNFLPPNPDILSPIGRKIFEEGIIKEYEPDFLRVVIRPSSSYLGHSFVIESALGYGGRIPGDAGDIRLYRYANKIPLLFDEGSDVSLKIVNGINWGYYKRPMDGPVAFFVHLCSTRIPFRSLGKEFIADVPEVEREIKASVRELLRSLSTFTRRIEKRKGLTRRLELYRRFLPKIAEFSTKLAGREEEPDIGPLLRKVKKRHAK
ncbi:MAG: DNA topoisomerase VI subunit B [Candidatus Geothermarchaeales archaeon]